MTGHQHSDKTAVTHPAGVTMELQHVTLQGTLPKVLTGIKAVWQRRCASCLILCPEVQLALSDLACDIPRLCANIVLCSAPR